MKPEDSPPIDTDSLQELSLIDPMQEGMGIKSYSNLVSGTVSNAITGSLKTILRNMEILTAAKANKLSSLALTSKNSSRENRAVTACIFKGMLARLYKEKPYIDKRFITTMDDSTTGNTTIIMYMRSDPVTKRYLTYLKNTFLPKNPLLFDLYVNEIPAGHNALLELYKSMVSDSGLSDTDTFLDVHIKLCNMVKVNETDGISYTDFLKTLDEEYTPGKYPVYPFELITQIGDVWQILQTLQQRLMCYSNLPTSQ